MAKWVNRVELVALLRAFDISVLADIRTIPRSRHNPQFNGDALRSALRSRRLRYVHLSELGGLRRPRKDSTNTGWRNASFRGFADYMLTEDFESGLAKVRALIAEGSVALMCAEAVPWRCHRSLVADALTAHGAHVKHITNAKRSTPHCVTAFAVVKGTRVTYPGEDSASRRLATRAPFHIEATVRLYSVSGPGGSLSNPARRSSSFNWCLTLEHVEPLMALSAAPRPE
jgi:hypothetical protein